MDAIVTTLRTVPLFSGLPREVLAQLVGELEEVSAPAGAAVVKQGEPGDAMYIVVSGTLEVQIEQEGRAEPLAVIGPGDWFGEMAILTGDPRSASVVALSEARLLRFPKERFLALSERHPVLLREIVRVLCRRLARTSEDMSRARRTYGQAFDSAVALASPEERRLLFRAALQERPDPDVLELLPGCAAASAWLEALAGRYPALMWREERERYAFHPRFREYLLDRLSREEGVAVVAGLHAALAAIQEDRGERRETITHWQRAQEWPRAARLLREHLGSSDPPAESDLALWLERFPEPVLFAEPELVKARADLLARRGQPEAAIALCRRALASGPAEAPGREALVRVLADLYLAQGDVEQAIACLKDHGDGEVGPSVALQEAEAARYLAAGRGQEAYAWARSARALARGLREGMAFPLRRARFVQGWGGAALALGAGLVVLTQSPAGLSPTGVRFLATLVAAAILWARARPPEYVVALALGLAWVLFGVAPARMAFAGFASSTWFLILGVLGLGAALGRSGFLYRVTLLALRRFPSSFLGHALALGLAGVASTVLIPTVQGRVALIGPMLVNVSDALGYPPRSRGSAGLATAAFLGFSLATTLFLTGTPTCLLAWGVLPEATRTEITWLRWLEGVMLLEALSFFAAIGWIVWRYRPAELRPVRSGLLDAQLAALGPVSREERTVGLLAGTVLLGWLTQGWHGVDPAWFALGGFCALLGMGVLDRAMLRSAVDWPFLLFMGMVFSLAGLTERVGMDAWLAGLVQGALGALRHPALAVAAAVLLTVAVRFVLPWQTAVPLLTVALGPFAQQAGLSPWIMALVALKAGNLFVMPYQNAYYLTLYYATEERAFTHAQTRPFAWAYGVIVLLAFLLSLPYWRALGLA